MSRAIRLQPGAVAEAQPSRFELARRGRGRKPGDAWPACRLGRKLPPRLSAARTGSARAERGERLLPAAGDGQDPCEAADLDTLGHLGLKSGFAP